MSHCYLLMFLENEIRICLHLFGSPTYLEAPDFYLDFVFVSLGHRPKETTLPEYKWMFFHVRNFARVTFRRRA